MKLIELSLNNFKIFKGMQTLKFPTVPAQNLKFVLRTYGLGKTKLIVAIRWVIFDKGNRIPEKDFNTQINCLTCPPPSPVQAICFYLVAFIGLIEGPRLPAPRAANRIRLDCKIHHAGVAFESSSRITMFNE